MEAISRQTGQPPLNHFYDRKTALKTYCKVHLLHYSKTHENINNVCWYFVISGLKYVTKIVRKTMCVSF